MRELEHEGIIKHLNKIVKGESSEGSQWCEVLAEMSFYPNELRTYLVNMLPLKRQIHSSNLSTKNPAQLALDKKLEQAKRDVMESDIEELKKGLLEANNSNVKLMAREITVGQLSYGKDGAIRFKNKPIEMRYQLRTLCVLFMDNHDKFLSYDNIKDETIPSSKRLAISFKTITKYVSELQVLLRQYFKKKVIFNQGKEGYIFDIDRES